MSQSKIVKNTFFYAVGELLPKVVSLLLLPVYTRFLTPEDYGIISYTQTIITFLAVLGTFALNTYVLRFYFIHKDENERRTLFGTIQLFVVFLNVIILLMAFLVMPSIIDHYHIQVPWYPYFLLAFIINFLDCFSIIPMVVYRIRQEAVKFVILGLSRTILTVLLTLYLVVYLKSGLIGTFQAQLYVNVPYLFVYLVVMHKYARWQIKWQYIKEGLNFSAPLISGTICYMLLSVSDRIILERNVSIGDLGIYNIACQMSLALSIVIRSGYRSVEPIIFQEYGKAGYYQFIRKIQSVFFCSIYVGAMIIALFSQEIFQLMTTEAFYNGYLLVPALIVGVIMTGQNMIYGGVLQGEGRTKLQGLATLVGAIVSVVVNLTLIPLYGIYAAAVASAVSFFVMNTIYFYAMTFPGKTMSRETFLAMLVPGISYPLFMIFGKVSLIGIVFKVIIVLMYGLLAIKLLNVNIYQFKSLLIRK